MSISNEIIGFRIISGIAAVLTLLITGCSPVGPNYSKPETSVSKSWNSAISGMLSTDGNNPESLGGWWSAFNDPELTSLIHRAVLGNLDVKNAQARVREERARRGIAVSPLFPTLNLSGSDIYSHSNSNTGTGKSDNLYSANFDSSWEIDIFGGIRRSVEAAQRDLEASQENLHDVLITLVSEVALNYVEVRTFQARIRSTVDNLKAQEQTYQLTLWRKEAGLTDELAVKQAKYNLENTRSQLPTLNTGMEEAMNRLSVLLGTEPGAINKELQNTKPIPEASEKIMVGVPADTIRRRPDIRQAERELAAQTARIGVATADLYPFFTLTGSIGTEALSLKQFGKNLASSGGYNLSGGPSMNWALFQGGAIRQNIKVQTALQEQALVNYESTVLNALEETENALVSYSDEQKRMKSLREAVAAAETAAKLAQNEYEAGIIDFTSVLDAQRSLLSFQDQLAQSNGTVTSNIIRVYKALGGGWQSYDLESKQPQGENNGK